MNASLTLSHNDIRNTTLDCDSLGIHYQVMSDIGLLATGKNTQIRRWDNQLRQFIPVAEWERHSFESDVFKFPNGRTFPVSTFMSSNRGFAKIERTFVGDDGRRYSWLARTSELTAYSSENDSMGAPIAKFHSRRILFGRRNASLELFPGYEKTLDTLVLTFLYVEYKRRQSRNASASAGAGAASAC
ncbi:hypothetical protein SCHPADRAFT_884838 [Schizopora paradoxa]|uniref:DUF6593 domain-containing protein n=1 Tax=Schizopora paradoxa TaxID=27342 RepID=A0A0H2S703_9AGAM|nr:hypothetical protein SCHPADRAFT_884838 [Schizopora paradoxa]